MENLKIKLKTKGNKSISFEDIDIIQNCWDLIFELENNNPKTIEDFKTNENFDDLLQNYYSIKMIYSEYRKEITKEITEIGDFVIKYMRRFCNALYTDELKDQLPAFYINN